MFKVGWGGNTAHEKVFRCLHRGGDTAQNSEFKDRGGTPHKIELGCTSAAGYIYIYIHPILKTLIKIKILSSTHKIRNDFKVHMGLYGIIYFGSLCLILSCVFKPPSVFPMKSHFSHLKLLFLQIPISLYLFSCFFFLKASLAISLLSSFES